MFDSTEIKVAFGMDCVFLLLVASSSDPVYLDSQIINANLGHFSFKEINLVGEFGLRSVFYLEGKGGKSSSTFNNESAQKIFFSLKTVILTAFNG